MIDYLNLLESFLYAFFFALIVSPLVISIMKREKIKQTILHYVDGHKSKNGTPTMGGLIFLISISVISLICFQGKSLYAKMSVIIFLAYGVVGFLDDYIKFKFKRNLGLRAYQKILFQLLVSFAVGFFVYKNIGGVLLIPFTNKFIDFGIWIIPFVILIYLATTNSVNLTDGLDGLATSTTLIFLISFVVLLNIFMETGVVAINVSNLEEFKNLSTLSVVACGVLLCFLLFNCFPAKIFMGDTGSLALGSLIASISIFSGMELYIPILGIVFVSSAVSVILQVAYYKLTKKRIFLMAPLHHHFEKKGVHEVRITFCYSLVSLIIGVVVILINIF